MGAKRPRPIVLDAGALIAVDRADRRVIRLLELAPGIHVPAGARAGRHMDARCQFQQPNHTPIGPINRDERARVEDYWPRTLRAHAVSSSVAGPISARMSARTSARLSRCARSVIAEATQALTDGARPAATAASAAWTAASSTVTVIRARIL